MPLGSLRLGGAVKTMAAGSASWISSKLFGFRIESLHRGSSPRPPRITKTSNIIVTGIGARMSCHCDNPRIAGRMCGCKAWLLCGQLSDKLSAAARDKSADDPRMAVFGLRHSHARDHTAIPLPGEKIGRFLAQAEEGRIKSG
jgi:hypothetical protein